MVLRMKLSNKPILVDRGAHFRLPLSRIASGFPEVPRVPSSKIPRLLKVYEDLPGTSGTNSFPNTFSNVDAGLANAQRNWHEDKFRVDFGSPELQCTFICQQGGTTDSFMRAAIRRDQYVNEGVMR